MESRIGLLRCRYRVVGDRSRVAVPTLQKLAQDTVLERYSEALDLTLGDDPCVYILRNVPVRLTLTNVNSRAEWNIAQKWGEHLCGAVVRTIVADDQSSGNVVRFESQGEYVAHFIDDLLGDRAWGQWFYGAFRSLLPLSKREALKAVLQQNRSHVASTFRHLSKLDCLRPMLALLNDAEMKWLWEEVILPRKPDVDESWLRPLFLAAVQLARSFGIWIGPEQPELVLLPELAGSILKSPDWTDRRDLTTTVIDILRFLRARGCLVPSGPSPVANSAASAHTIGSELDWLDSEWLIEEVHRLYVHRSQDSLPATRPLAQSHRVLLEKMAFLIRTGGVRLDRSRPASEGNAAILFAAVAVCHPELEKTAGAAVIIQRLLDCWEFMLTIEKPNAVLQAFEEDRLEPMLGDFTDVERHSALGAFRAIQSLQPLASEVLRMLLDSSSPASLKADAGSQWSSNCAGLFLLLRALQDLRVPHLAALADLPRLSDLLLGLGVAWAGYECRNDGMVDPALTAWANFAPDSQPELSSIESPRFLGHLLELLHDRHTVSRSPISLFETRVRERAALVISDASGTMFPLAAWWNDSQDKPQIEAQLVKQWQLATNSEPTVGREESARINFDAAIEELAAGWPAETPPSITVMLTAMSGLKIWAQWLPGIASASMPYLLKNLIRRPGTIHVSDEQILIRLKPGAIDIVLEMAGYLRKIESVPWLNGRNVLFQIDKGSR